MKITYESLRQFVRENGEVRFYAPMAEVVMRKDGTHDLLDTIEKATTFFFGGKQYSRADFEKLLDEKNSKRVSTQG